MERTLLAIAALVFIGCGLEPEATLPEEALPFGTVDMWTEGAAGKWEFKKGIEFNEFDDSPWPIEGIDCSAPCGNPIPKQIEHISGADLTWTSCGGGFISSAGNTFLFACEDRPKLLSFNAFAGPEQTHHITIWYEGRGGPQGNLVHYIITTAIPPPPSAPDSIAS